MIDEKIYQYQEALKVFGNDQVLREAMTTYLETAEPMLGSIKNSYRAGWTQDVRKGVHWLKGGLSYLHAPRVREACIRNEMALVAYSPIAKGKVRKDEVLSGIGKAHGKSAAQVCLRWLMQQNVSAIPRTSKLERLSENFEVFDFELSEAEMAAITALGSRDGRLTDFGFSPKWD